MNHHKILSSVKIRISQKKYLQAEYLFRQLSTNYMYEYQNIVLNSNVINGFLKYRNSNNISEGFKNNSIKFNSKFNSEIMWNLLILKTIKKDLANDIYYFNRIENGFFNNDLNEASEYYFKLSDVAKNSHKGQEILVHLNQKECIKNLPDYTQDAYKKLSLDLFVSKIQDLVEPNKIKKQIVTEFENDTILSEYLIFKTLHTEQKLDKYLSFMAIDRAYNDIDLYETIIKFLIECCVSYKIQLSMINVIEEIYETTKDKRLLPVLFTYKKNYKLSESIIEQQEYFEYELISDYQKVLELTERNISKYDADYTSFFFYLKSNIILEKDTPEIINENSFLLEVYKGLKEIFYLKNKRIYYETYSFMRLMEKYKVFSWSYLLYYYVFAYVDKLDDSNLFYFNYVYCYDYNFNPIRLNQYTNDIYQHKFPISFKFGNLISHKTVEQNFDFNQLSWLNLLNYYRSNELDETFKLSSENILNFHLKYIKIIKLINKGFINKALIIYVENIVEYPQYINLHPVDRVYESIADNLNVDPIYRLISLCYYIDSNDKSDEENIDYLSTATVLLEEILEEILEIDKVDGFCKKYNHLGNNIIVFFLNNIWQVELMKNNLVYSPPNDYNEERIKICKKLIEIDSANKNKYMLELQERVKATEISKITNLLHSSKVFVDIEAVKKNCFSRLDKSFESFKQLRSSSKSDQTLILVRENSSNDAEELILENYNTIDQNNIVSFKGHTYKTHLVDRKNLMKFRDIISDVTNEFLMGSSGLNSYLSTGIRHGILRNTLRNPLEEAQLLPSQYDGSIFNKYAEGDINKNEIYNILEDFAKNLDQTIDFITERLIQISINFEFDWILPLSEKHLYVTVNPNVFNYNISLAEVTKLIEKGNENLKSLIDDLITLLWYKTDECLVNMKLILDDSVKTRFREAFKIVIDQFISLGYSESSDIVNSIAIAQSNFFRAFNETLNWFNKNNVYQLPELPISSLIQISRNIITKTVYNLKNWDNIKLDIDNEILLSGKHVSDLVYIFLDLFNNAYEHSKIESNDLEIDLTIKQSSKIVNISFNNNVDLNLIDINFINNKLSEIQNSISANKSGELSQKDRNSGLLKIHNRLCNNMLFKNSRLDFSLDEKNSKFNVLICFSINKE